MYGGGGPKATKGRSLRSPLFRFNSTAGPQLFRPSSDGNSLPFSSISTRNRLMSRIRCNLLKTNDRGVSTRH
jgi:hypothetical protein